MNRIRSAPTLAASVGIFRWLAPILLLALAAGCGRGDGGAEGVGEDTSSAAVVDRDTLPEAEESESRADESEPPDTIYYDLTRFEWYRRGEPIIIGERRYRSADVEATGERELKREGSYEGVDYYADKDAKQPYDSIFVPVYPGYWLPFVDQQGGGEDTGG